MGNNVTFIKLAVSKEGNAALPVDLLRYDLRIPDHTI